MSDANDTAKPGPASGAGTPASLTDYIGAALRHARQRQHLTIQDVAELASVSRGMLSRIETGQATPSLDTLERLVRSLGLSMSSLFKDFDAPQGAATYVPAGTGLDVARRGTRRGHSYELLTFDQGPKKRFEAFLITLDDESETFPRFQHDGTEFMYMLRGRFEYRHGHHSYTLGPGDALTFDGNIPHGPDKLIELPIQFLSVMHYDDAQD